MEFDEPLAQRLLEEQQRTVSDEREECRLGQPVSSTSRTESAR
jgi:hypothetical protein